MILTTAASSILISAAAAATTTPMTGEPLSGNACALRVVQLLSDGKTTDAAALFAKPVATTPADLKSLVKDVVPLRDIAVVEMPRFKRFTQATVSAPGPADGVVYTGAWVNATTLDGMPIQFHLARAPGKPCELLAIHLDRQSP